jgi:hypothetical protein
MANLSQPQRSLQTRARLKHESRKFVSRLNDRYERSATVLSGVSAGKNLVQVNGQYYPAEGIDGQGGALAVVNIGTPAVARYAPPNNRSVLAVAGTGLGGSGGGGGGGGGTTYGAGEAITIDGLSNINVKRDVSGAIGLSGSNGLMVNVSNGIAIVSNALTLALAATPGLEYGTGSDAGKLRVKAGAGIALDGTGVLLNFAAVPGLEIGTGSDANKVQVKTSLGLMLVTQGVQIKLQTTSGLALNSTGLALDTSVAGDGLMINGTTRVLAVGEGDGIDVLTDTIKVNVTEIINYSAGLTDDGSNNIGVKLNTTGGLRFNSASFAVEMGTPAANVTVSSTNSVGANTHNHAVTTSNDTGSTAPKQIANILASNSVGGLTLHQLGLYGDLTFSGGDRTIDASNTLRITPGTDLVLDPDGLILTPNPQELRTETINDLPTGIDGYRIWNRYANYTQLTIGAIKADELYVRVFVADETRIDRGEEYWSKSFGIVETDFVVPAVNATVDVWFEDAPGMSGFNLFGVGDYLLVRTIDWGTGLTVQKIWFQIPVAKLAQQTTAVNGVDRQQWRIKRIAGGLTGTVIKRGNLALDTGVVGQGWIHLSALSQDGGPFIQVGKMTSISTVPQFTNYVRMGNLKGTVDYTADVFGFAAGNGAGGLGTAPSAGFSGITAESTNGLRLFNTSIYLYNASILQLVMSQALGLRMLEHDSEVIENRKYIGWYTNVTDTTLNSLTANITSASAIGTGAHVLRIVKNAHNTLTEANTILLQLRTNSPTTIPAVGPYIRIDRSGSGVSSTSHSAGSHIFDGEVAIAPGGVAVPPPASTLHVYELSTATGSTAGVTIENQGSGDTLLQFLITAARRWVVGVDNSDFEKFKISNNAALGGGDAFVIDSIGSVGIGTSTPLSMLHVQRTVNAGRNTFLITNNGTGAAQAGFRAGLNPTNDTVNYVSMDIFGAGFTTTGLIEATGTIIEGNGGGNMIISSFSSVKPMIFTTGNSRTGRMWITASGFIGVGTGTPASPLHIYENTANIGSNVGVTIEQDGTGDALLQFVITGVHRWVAGSDNGDGDKFKIDFAALGTNNPFVIDFSGNVGIGTSTPGIDVVSTLDISGRVLQVDGGSNAASMIVRSQNSAFLDLISTSSLKILQMSTGGGLSWLWGLDSAGVPEHRFLTMNHSTGYVSINKLIPEVQLDIVSENNTVIFATLYGNTNWPSLGMARARGTAAIPTQVTTGTVIGSVTAIGYTSSGWPAAASMQMHAVATQNFTSTATGTKILFLTTPNNSASPVTALELGESRQFLATGIRDVTSVSSPNVFIDTGSGQLMRVISSARYKTDIQPLPASYGDDFIMGLRPVTFRDKGAQHGPNYLGFLAEDVHELGARELVSYDGSDRPDALNYDRFIVPVVAALQDVIPYKARIARLENRVKELERRLS